ncbi:cofilin [Alternaria alternata]|nr:cofilin [Alternaria alternata]
MSSVRSCSTPRARTAAARRALVVATPFSMSSTSLTTARAPGARSLSSAGHQMMRHNTYVTKK